MQDMTGAVVVGYDGTDHADAALDWAADEAVRRGDRLAVLYAANYAGMVVGAAGVGTWMPEEATQAAQEVAALGADRARRRHEGMRVESLAPLSHPVSALTEASGSADLLVVGTRGHGAVVGALLGSVAFGVTAHAGCPVVVVPAGDAGTTDGDTPRRAVVVGVDGSVSSDVAIDKAAEYAAAVGAPLRLVTAWHHRASESWVAAYWTGAYPGQRPADVARAAAAELLASTRERVLAARPGLDVITQAVEGPAVQVLAAASADASIVFVGARGHGQFMGLLLGSVSRGVIHHATCPVQVVRNA